MTEKFCQVNNDWWHSITVKVKDSIVFLDDGATECLHWNGGVQRFLDAGAVNVLELSTLQMSSALNSGVKKSVFLITTPIWNATLHILEDVLSSGIFTECTVVTSVHPIVHQLARYGSRNANSFLVKDDIFLPLKEQLLNAMGNRRHSMDICYIPMFFAHICSNLFLTPTFADLFPLLSSNLESMHLENVSDPSTEITFDDLKLETQVLLRSIATNFEATFEMMNLREDCYSMGRFSRIICNEIEQLPSTKLRRKKSGTRSSILFIDRNLDLSQATSYEFETLLDHIMHYSKKLSNYSTDVVIDMSPLSYIHKSCSDDILISGSLSNNNTQDNRLLYSVTNDRQKDCIMKLNRKLVDVCTKEQLSVGTTSRLTRISAESLLNKVVSFKNEPRLIIAHQGLLQYTLATIQSLQSDENAKINQLLGVEKALTQMLAESQSANFALRLAQMIKERKTRLLSVEELVIMLVRVCAIKNIFKDASESEDILKAVLGDALLRDYTELPNYLKAAIGPEVDEWTVHKTTEKLFKILQAISNSRGEFKKYKAIYDSGNNTQPAVCVPLIKQLIDDIYDPTKPELTDLECKSTGIKDMLKSGLSLFLNVNKPRPADSAILIIYFVGGVTSTEVRRIKDQVANYSPATEVLIGSTRLSLPKDALKLILSELKFIS